MANPRIAAVVVGVASLLGLSGCGGGDSGPSAVATPTPRPAPVKALLTQGSSAVEENQVLRLGGPVAAAADVEFILNWTFDTSFVYTFIVRGECVTDNEFDPTRAGCQVLAQSGQVGAKPRTTLARNVAAGNIEIYFGALGGGESFSWQVFSIVPPQGTAAVHSAAPAFRLDFLNRSARITGLRAQ